MSKKELGRLGFEAIEFVIRKFLAKNKEGIATIPGRDMKDKVRLLVDKYAKLFSLKGKDVNKVTVKEVQNEIDYGMALSKQRAKEEALKKFPPETHKFFGRPLTEKDFKEIDKLYPPKKDPFQGFTPKIVPKETEAQVKARLLKTQKETLERLRNKKKPPEEPEFASGGIAGELRLHRQGYAGGKKVDLDRRMILKGMGALAALPVVGKFFKLAKPLAKVRDIRVKMKTDMDWSYEGPESGWEGGTWLNVDFIPLTKKGTKILDDLAKNKKISKSTHGKETYYGVGNSEDGLMAVEDIKKMKGNMELETSVHDKVKGSVKGEYDTTKVYSGKDIDSKKILRESSDLADFPYHDNVFQDEFTEEIISTMGSRVKKVSGGLVDLLSL